VEGIVGVGMVTGGDEGKGIWLMDVIYIYKTAQLNFLQMLKVEHGDSRGDRSWGNPTRVKFKPILNCHNESKLHNEYILIKVKK
jgi:hypothetical protein